MDFLDKPVPFTEAVKHLLAKGVMPTGLSSAELREVDAGLRRQALFSARTLNAQYLANVKDVVTSILNPQTIQRPDRMTDENPQGNVTVGLNPATAREQLRQGLADIGYAPSEDERGTIKDLGSDQRLNLVVKTNVQLAQGAGQFIQGNSDADVVDLYPAWELVRYEDRMVPRGEKIVKGEIEEDPGNDWPSRFQAAAEDAGDEDAIRILRETGRMIALKSSDTWQALGDGAGGYEDTLGNPFPPFAFNSGMWTEDVSRKDCEDIGLIDAGEETQPAKLDIASLFASAADVLKSLTS